MNSSFNPHFGVDYEMELNLFYFKNIGMYNKHNK